MSDVNRPIRLEGLSPIKRRIGRSRVFAKPLRLQPSAPPSDGVRPRRVAAKTGPPALPLRHRPRHPHWRILISARSAGPSWRAPAFSEVRPGARAHTRRRRASHWPESTLRARSLASLIVRFRPASGPRRPGAARRQQPPPPWLPLAPARSDASWMADSSLRCRGCGVAT